MRIGDLRPGWAVVTNDGHRLGHIKQVGQHFVEVSTGRFAATLYVPSSAIGNVHEGRVELNLAHAEVDASGWRQPPRLPDDLHTGPERDQDREI